MLLTSMRHLCAQCSHLFSLSLPAHAAISAQFEAMTTQDPPKKGKNKVVS